jgi:hypothetical protein
MRLSGFTAILRHSPPRHHRVPTSSQLPSRVRNLGQSSSCSRKKDQRSSGPSPIASGVMYLGVHGQEYWCALGVVDGVLHVTVSQENITPWLKQQDEPCSRCLLEREGVRGVAFVGDCTSGNKTDIYRGKQKKNV